MTTPTLAELALHLANAGPQWRPEADRIAAELVTAMRQLYPKAPEGVPRELCRSDGRPGLANGHRRSSGERERHVA